MTFKLKESLEEDLWKIINNEDVEEKDENLFIAFIFYLFLKKEMFTMADVMKLAKQLKKEYNKILKEAEEVALQGEPLKALKLLKKDFVDNIKPIINKIDA